MSLWKPHNYQMTAVSFLLSNPTSGLFLDPGLGKTSITLATINILKNCDEIGGVLIVAPMRVIYSVWPNEVEKWDNFNGITHTILHGKDKEKNLDGPQKDLYLINPEGLPWLLEHLRDRVREKKEHPFDTLWVDESTKFKSPTAKTRFKTLSILLPLFKRRHIMTGTPAPNGFIDLWSQIYLLDEGKALRSNFYQFRNYYFQTEDWNRYTHKLRPGSKGMIEQAIAPLVLEMSAEKYLSMPSLVYNNLEITLPKQVQRHYKEMEHELFTELDGEKITAQATVAAAMKCHQIANGAVYKQVDTASGVPVREVVKVHRGKVEALGDLIDELNGKPLLVAYYYKHDLEAIRQFLGKDIPHIGSGVSPDEVDEIQKKWNGGLLSILVANPSSMSHGLNLQGACNDVCWFSLTWNLEEYQQFIRRVYRQGVSGSVRVHHIVAKDTIDEAMLYRLGDKAKKQTDLRNALSLYRTIK